MNKYLVVFITMIFGFVSTGLGMDKVPKVPAGIKHYGRVNSKPTQSKSLDRNSIYVKLDFKVFKTNHEHWYYCDVQRNIHSDYPIKLIKLKSGEVGCGPGKMEEFFTGYIHIANTKINEIKLIDKMIDSINIKRSLTEIINDCQQSGKANGYIIHGGEEPVTRFTPQHVLQRATFFKKLTIFGLALLCGFLFPGAAVVCH